MFKAIKQKLRILNTIMNIFHHSTKLPATISIVVEENTAIQEASDDCEISSFWFRKGDDKGVTEASDCYDYNNSFYEASSYWFRTDDDRVLAKKNAKLVAAQLRYKRLRKSMQRSGLL